MARFFYPGGRVGAALALTMLFELCLFADCHYRRWEEVIVPLDQPAAHQGEGLVIRGNGLGYYAWLRSLLVDHDWDFANEFDDHRVAGDYVPPPTYKTELGRRANQWSVGPACLWAAFVVPGHYVLVMLGDWSPWATDGYSLPYQFLVAAASLTMSYVGLVFLYYICLQFARPSRAALAAILMTLGSTLAYYDAVEVSMAHGVATSVLAGLVWFWLKTYGSLHWRRWIGVGLLIGAACLMRWQLATFAVLPIGEVLLSTCRTREGLGKRFTGLALAGFAAVIAFLPQMVAWRCVYGHWLVEPIQQIARHWLSPSIWEILLSEDRSLFYWTPICLLAFLGYFLPPPKGRAEPTSLMLAAFALQVYALASVWGEGEHLDDIGNSAGAFLSKAYGMRHLTEAVVALASGLVVLLERSSRIPIRFVCGLTFIMAAWNLVLVSEYIDRTIPADAGLDPQALVSNTCRHVEAEPLAFFLLIEALGLILLVLLWGNDEHSASSPLPPGEGPAGRNYAPNADLVPSVLRWTAIVVLMLATLFVPSPPQKAEIGFLYRDFRDTDGTRVTYALFVPHGYRRGVAYPALMYLHGSGRRNWDTNRPLQEPLATVIREREASFDMIAVFPQSESGTWEVGSPDLELALRTLEEVQRTYHVDPERISLTGTSRGGFGVWNLAAAHPRRWAAIVPVCGGGNPREAARFKDIPCWCFHGERDAVIPVEESRRMIAAMREAGGNPRYAEYPGVGHNCWEKAYQQSNVLDWLRQQARNQHTVHSR